MHYLVFGAERCFYDLLQANMLNEFPLNCFTLFNFKLHPPYLTTTDVSVLYSVDEVFDQRPPSLLPVTDSQLSPLACRTPERQRVRRSDAEV